MDINRNAARDTYENDVEKNSEKIQKVIKDKGERRKMNDDEIRRKKEHIRRDVTDLTCNHEFTNVRPTSLASINRLTKRPTLFCQIIAILMFLASYV